MVELVTEVLVFVDVEVSVDAVTLIISKNCVRYKRLPEVTDCKLYPKDVVASLSATLPINMSSSLHVGGNVIHTASHQCSTRGR